MLRVTADSNIYVSALLSSGGNPYRFLELARAADLRLAVSDAILDEIADVLGRKFDWPETKVAEARRQIEQFTEKVRPAVSLDVVKEDPDDNRILECATSARSDYIVTGDKDLLRIKLYNGVSIASVADFLTIMAARAESDRDVG